MSFRLRLILAFALLALLQAGLFTLLSDQLLRDGLDGEASERLALVGSLFTRELKDKDWPLPAGAGAPWRKRLLEELRDYASSYGLERATLLIGSSSSLDSKLGILEAPVEDWWSADGLKAPKVSGLARVSGPLFKSEEGWHKTLYLKVSREKELWLRVEAGTPFLGSLASFQKRLYRLALALVIPSLLLGLGLAWTLSRRADELRRRLIGARQGVRLGGRDEFSSVAEAVDELLKSLQKERDLSERLLQSRISQARHLAFGVAHELRNPLAGLSLTTDLLKRRSGEGAKPEELKEMAERVQGEVARVEGTVARFLDFARTPVLQMARLDLKAEVLAASQGLRPQPALLGKAGAKADAKALAVILGVLLSNAAEAAGEAGKVAVGLEEGPEEASLRVWDSGPGLPADARERLFSPFYTTKPKGMGLGLATASSLADAMGGRLSLLEDAKTFELVLPL